MPLQILDFLSLRTFSSIWYWILVAFLWAAISHRPMGVPYDLVWRTQADEGEARAALDTVSRALARRLIKGFARGGAIFVGIVSAVLSMLLLLSTVYGLEIAQGLLLILLPLTVVGALSHRAARRIDAGEDTVRHLRRLRLGTQAVGLIAIFVSAFWGIYVNLVASVL